MILDICSILSKMFAFMDNSTIQSPHLFQHCNPALSVILRILIGGKYQRVRIFNCWNCTVIIFEVIVKEFQTYSQSPVLNLWLQSFCHVCYFNWCWASIVINILYNEGTSPVIIFLCCFNKISKSVKGLAQRIHWI